MNEFNISSDIYQFLLGVIARPQEPFRPLSQSDQYQTVIPKLFKVFLSSQPSHILIPNNFSKIPTKSSQSQPAHHLHKKKSNQLTSNHNSNAIQLALISINTFEKKITNLASNL